MHELHELHELKGDSLQLLPMQRRMRQQLRLSLQVGLTAAAVKVAEDFASTFKAGQANGNQSM